MTSGCTMTGLFAVIGLVAVATAQPAFTIENLAMHADIEAQGQTPGAVADGIKGVDGKGEWVPDTRSTWYGRIDYPCIEMKWPIPQTINKVVLYDRPALDQHLAAGELVFDDGGKVQIWAIPNDGTPKTVVFEPRTASKIRLQAVDGVGDHIGLSEWEVYCDPQARPERPLNRQYPDYVSYVDPTIETGRGRWFFCTPGSRPFGMVSLAAHTRNKAQGGGGYNYNSTEVRGFSMIHNWVMAGISIMPATGKIDPNLGERGWKSPFSHDTEIIEPGYHRVYLDRYSVDAEYTSTDRVGFFRFKYTRDAEASLLVSLGGSMGPLSVVDGTARKVTASRIEGSIGMTDRIWGGPSVSHAWFVLDIDRSMTRMDAWKGASERMTDIEAMAKPLDERGRRNKQTYLFKDLPAEQAGVAAVYDVHDGDVVLVKIAISYTSLENARKNMAAECPHWDFESVRTESRRVWNDWLGRIEVKGGQEKTRVKFYTDLWHALLGRHKIDDVNGCYPSHMGGDFIQTVPMNADGKPRFHMYNSDAFWLTMWNLNVLWGLGWPEMLDEFAASLVQYADVGGHVPRGPGAGGYTGIMTGCPGTSLITAAWQKGLLTKVDVEKAYQAMKRSHPRLISGNENNPGILVQGAFEYWALAQMAEERGATEDAKSYQPWIDKWKTCYDSKHKLLMARGVTDPLKGQGWVEANAWQGTFGVSHDIAGLAEQMGGTEVLAERLNFAFEQSAADDFVYGYRDGYVSYANQPGCSGAHVFNHAGYAWLSQYWVRRVSRQAYGGTNPNLGYGGHDEDQGQMGGISALMKIGLFSLRGTCSKDPIYEITAPEFDEVIIHLDPRYYSGDTFTIKTHDNSEENCYIQRASLNGKPLENCWIRHEDVSRGGVLELWLGPEPNRRWGRSPVGLSNPD